MTDTMRATLDTLYEDYLARGCPCRFPRFRAVAKQWGLPSGIVSSEDRDGLVGVFEEKVPLVERRTDEGGWNATCAKCDASVRMGRAVSSHGETSADYLMITTAQPDVGARLEQPLVRCRPWRIVGPGSEGIMVEAGRKYPFVDEADWLAWMRA
jgi:hypothetical protein